MMAPVFLPYADSIEVQEDIIKAAAETSQGSVQLVAGMTAQETMAFLNDSSIANHNKIYQTIVQISTQHIFLNPTIALLNQFSAQGNAARLLTVPTGIEDIPASETVWRAIPYSAVGGDGILLAFAPDRVTVCVGDEERVLPRCYVAVCETLGHGEYEGLIGSALGDYLT